MAKLTTNPAIGDTIMSPNPKFQVEGRDIFDSLLADGSVVDENTHPILHSKLPKGASNDYTTLYDSGDADSFSVLCADETGTIIHAVKDAQLVHSTDGGITFNPSLLVGGRVWTIACSRDGLQVYAYDTTNKTLSYSADFTVGFESKSFNIGTPKICCSGDGRTLFMSVLSSGQIFRIVDFNVDSWELCSVNGAGSIGAGFTACNYDGSVYYENGYTPEATKPSSSAVVKWTISGTTLTRASWYDVGDDIYCVAYDNTLDQVLLIVSTTYNTLVLAGDLISVVLDDTTSSVESSIYATDIGWLYQDGRTIKRRGVSVSLPNLTPLTATAPYRVIGDLT